MQTTLVATMLQSRMRPDVGQLSVELAVLRHIYVCSDVNMSLSRCWWRIIVLSKILRKDVFTAHANNTSSGDAAVWYAT